MLLTGLAAVGSQTPPASAWRGIPRTTRSGTAALWWKLGTTRGHPEREEIAERPDRADDFHELANEPDLPPGDVALRLAGFQPGLESLQAVQADLWCIPWKRSSALGGLLISWGILSRETVRSRAQRAPRQRTVSGQCRCRGLGTARYSHLVRVTSSRDRRGRYPW